MNEELKAATERLRNPYPRAAVSGGADWDSWYMPIQEMKDLRLAAEAYLAEHPVDDDETVTGEWLQAVGFWARGSDDLCSPREFFFGDINRTPVPIWMLINTGNYGVILDKPGRHWELSFPGRQASLGYDLPTRGDVRRLCKALGIELKEDRS